MMKKTIMALCGVFAATAFLNAADANLWMDGSFEKTKVATAEEQAKFKAKKWDTDHQGMLQPGWCPAKKVHQMRLVDCAKDPEQEDNVRSGVKSLMLKSAGHFFTAKKFSRGKYKLEMFVKGEGKIRVITYIYAKNGAYKGQVALHGGLIQTGNDWKKLSYTTEMGKGKEDVTHFVIAIACTDGKPVYLDDISLTKVEK